MLSLVLTSTQRKGSVTQPENSFNLIKAPSSEQMYHVSVSKGRRREHSYLIFTRFTCLSAISTSWSSVLVKESIIIPYPIHTLSCVPAFTQTIALRRMTFERFFPCAYPEHYEKHNKNDQFINQTTTKVKTLLGLSFIFWRVGQDIISQILFLESPCIMHKESCEKDFLFLLAPVQIQRMAMLTMEFFRTYTTIIG